jgi:hypothetical protein
MKMISLGIIAAVISTAVFSNELVAEPELSAAQIVEKNVAARGGLEAWRKIQTMVWLGHIERTHTTDAPNLPYVLEQKRPNKTRFEIMAKSQVGARIYDGVHGWKMHPTSNGVPALEPYTAEELNYARDVQGIDGELVDYQSKGISVTLEGVDEVEGHKAYRLSVKLPSGASHRVWIDADTFLDVKYERPIRNAGAPNTRAPNILKHADTVSVFYRNYQKIDGLQIPLLIESGSGTVKATDKMVIEKVVLNPPLDDQRFAKPAVPAGAKALAAESVPARAFRPNRPRSAALATQQLSRSPGRQ